jgi:hypothetical protein
MLFFRQLPWFAALLSGMAVSPAAATEAEKLLPADTKVIATINLRQLLTDLGNTKFVQAYLDQYRLALKGDEKNLRNYYRLQELQKYEGIT